jgi:hypothetical protein
MVWVEFAVAFSNTLGEQLTLVGMAENGCCAGYEYQQNLLLGEIGRC